MVRTRLGPEEISKEGVATSGAGFVASIGLHDQGAGKALDARAHSILTTGWTGDMHPSLKTADMALLVSESRIGAQKLPVLHECLNNGFSGC